MKQNKYEIDMCNGSIMDKLISFSLPLMLSGILQLMFNAVDIVVVGRFSGSSALAAVGSTTALINVFTNLFIGVSLGANVLAARFYASGRQKEMSETVHTSILLALISGIAMAIVGLLFSRWALELMGTPADVIDQSSLYMKIYFLGMPFMMLYNFGAAILRSIGDTKRPLYFLTIAGVVNVVLNLVFVILFNMSVAGVAIATVISQVISSLLVTRSLTHEQGALQLHLNQLTVDKECLIDIVKVGLPAGLQGCIFSLSNVVIQSSVNSFGSIVVAGNSAAVNIEGFIYVTMNSFHQSAVTFSSQNYGAKQYKRCDKALLISIACAATIGTALGFLFIAFGTQLLSLYTTDPEVIKAGLIRMDYMFRYQAINGSMDVMVGGLRAIGYSVLPTIVSLTGVCAFRLLWIATIFKASPSIHILYLVYPVSWTITTTAHVISYLIVRRKLNKKEPQNNK